MRVTVVGYDATGEATAKAMRRFGHEVQVQDANPELQAKAAEAGFPSSLIRPDVTFVCTPTGIGPDGLLSTAALRETFAKTPGIIAIRSSVPLGFTRSLPDTGRAVYVPCLADRGDALEAEAASPHVIVGADSLETAIFVRNLWPPGVVRLVRPEEAEMAMLAMQAFLAMEASFAQMLNRACEQFSADFHQVAYTLRSDQRVGMWANLKPERWTEQDLVNNVLHLTRQLGSPRLLEAIWASDHAEPAPVRAPVLPKAH